MIGTDRGMRIGTGSGEGLSTSAAAVINSPYGTHSVRLRAPPFYILKPFDKLNQEQLEINVIPFAAVLMIDLKVRQPPQPSLLGDGAWLLFLGVGF